MKNQEETPIDEITLTEMLKEIFTHNKQTHDFMVKLNGKLEEKEKSIAELSKQTLTLINSFETKYKNIQVMAPKPDLSGVMETLASSLMAINKTIDKGPKPVVKQIRFQLFPEQVRNPEYYKAMLSRLIWGILGVMLLFLGYLLLNKLIK
jgi:hypothetical protein